MLALTKGNTTLTKYAETPTKDPMYVVRKTLHTVRLVYGWYATICLDTAFYVRLSYFAHMTLLQLCLKNQLCLVLLPSLSSQRFFHNIESTLS